MIRLASVLERCRHSILSTCLIAAVGCDVDDRELTPIEWTITEVGNGGADSTASGGASATAGATSDYGGASSSSSLGNGGTDSTRTTFSGGSSSGSIAGGAGWLSELPGQCNDLNQNGILDRQETLASNPTFQAESQGWTPAAGVSLVWNASDACHSAASGSLNVTYQKAGNTVGWSTGAATQCVAATPNRNYLLSASIFLPTSGSRGGLGISFFQTSDCSGLEESNNDSPLLMFTGLWTPSTVNAIAPANARSLTARLIAGRSDWTSTQAQADILVDGILLTLLP